MSESAVIISLYNGQNFILDQLNSITKECKDIKFYFRDDASTDSTVTLVSEWLKNNSLLAHFETNGLNLGPSGSFSHLLQAVDEKYVFLSDQDDVWLPGRVQKLLAKMKALEATCSKGTPLLVFSDARVVDSNLNTISESFWNYEKNHPGGRLKINRLLVQSFAPGCTMLINNELAKLAIPIPKGVIMHDWWLLLVALSFGRIAFIDEPTLAYRQHGGNSVGAKKINLTSPKKIFLLFKNGNNTIRKTTAQAGLFLEHYRPLLAENQIMLIETYATLFEHGLIKRRMLIIKHKFYKSSFIRNIGLFFLV